MTEIPLQDCTVGNLLKKTAQAFPDREALVSPERNIRWTFDDLKAESTRIARACLAAGLAVGDRALVWAPNIPEWIALQYGLARAGVVLVTANTSFKKKEISYLLEKSGARALFFARGARDNDFEPTVQDLSPVFARANTRVIGLDGATAAGSTSFDAFLTEGHAVAEDDLERVEASLDQTQFINMQYTSGTTGFPKGVMLSHQNIVQNAASISEVLQVTPEDRLCLTVPLFHCFGCVIGTLVSHGSGAAMVLNDVFSPDAILDTVEKERCSLIYGVPTMYLAELEAQKERPRDLSSLRVGVMAGATCPPSLIRRVESELHVPGIVVAYGLTEASPGVSLSRPDDDLELRATTVGRALPRVEMRIVDPDTGNDVPDGKKGELWTRGPNIMLGYDGEPEATEAVITKDGWLRTGDLAIKAQDGCYQIVGRIKDLIIRGGENLSPAEIEDALRSHECVLDVAVFGITSEFFGEEVAAAVLLQPEAVATEDDLKDHVRRQLSAQKIPTIIVVVEEFPLTGSGKIQRFKLRKLVEQDDG